MVEMNDPYFNARPTNSPLRWMRRLVAVACLIAIPGILMAIDPGQPETFVFALALCVILVGMAGLCLFERR